MAYSGLQIFQLNSGSPSAATDVVPFTGESAGNAQKTALSEIVRVGMTSGSVSSGKLANGSVVSGTIASGQIGVDHLASGVIPASFVLSSGVITSGYVGDAAVNANNIASGVIPAPFALSSGVITSGFVGDAAINSGNIASGQIGINHLASGVIVSGLAAVSLYSIGRNSTGDIMSGVAAVYISGSFGNRPSLGLGLAISDAYSAGIFGLVQSNIANNADGVVVTQGQLENIDTSMFNAGDKLWLSATVSGGLTNVRPIPPNHTVFIGNVIRSHPNLGVIEVTIQNGYELSDELHNVASGTVTSGQILQYSSGLWWNKDIQINSGNISSGAVTQVTATNVDNNQTYRLLFQKDDGTVSYNSGFMYNPSEGTLYLGSGGIILSDVPNNNTIIAARSITNPTVPSGQVCVVVGDSILENNTAMTGVTALGYAIGTNDGDQAYASVAVGWQAFNNYLGANNTGVGFRVASVAASGSQQVAAFGANAAGFARGVLNNVTAIGPSAGANLTTDATACNYFGGGANTGVASGQSPIWEMALAGPGSGNFKINMGDGAHTRFWTNGVIETPRGIEVVHSGGITKAYINSGGEIFGTLSSGMVTSGIIASGQVGSNHLASGLVLFNTIASGGTSFVATNNPAILSGSNTSVFIGDDVVASGNGHILRTVAIGFEAGRRLGSGTTQTVLVGRGTGFGTTVSNPPLNGVTAVGAEAAGLVTSGSTNLTAIGLQAGQNCAGTGNTYIGRIAGQGGSNYTGANNVGIGAGAHSLVTTGQNNVVIGVNAGLNLTTGGNHVLVGRDAGAFVTGSSGNTCIGWEAGKYEITSGNMTTRSNITCLGQGTGIGADNQVQIGNNLTTTYVYGAVQNRSDLRDKTEVENINYGLNFIEKIRPVQYKWNYRDAYWDTVSTPSGDIRVFAQDEYNAGARKRNRKHVGVIAQELEATCKELGIDFAGLQHWQHNDETAADVYTVGYEEFIPVLIKAVQELSSRVKALEAK